MNYDAFKLSPIRRRVYSFLIDLLILVPYNFLTCKVFRESENIAGEEFANHVFYGALLTLYFTGIFFIIIFPEGLWGQTLGKWAMGIKVVDKTNKQPCILGSIIRHFLDPIDMCFLVGYLFAQKNISKQRIGDMVAHTIVVRKDSKELKDEFFL